jgi:RTX calcium-binding nonapeptide repeat (4 copies)
MNRQQHTNPRKAIRRRVAGADSAAEGRTKRRLIGALVAAAAAACMLSAAPRASAEVTCSYDGLLKITGVSLTGPADVAQIGVSAGEIVVTRSPNVPVSCTNGPPTVTNTNELQVYGIGAQDDTVIFDDPAALSPGFSDEPGDNEIEVSVNLGAQSFGGDTLRLLAPAGGSFFRFGTLGINTNTTPTESERDVDLVYAGEEDIDAFGGTGVDTLSAAGGAGTGDPLDTPIAFHGGGGADLLTGGAVGDFLTGDEDGDTLKGGPGDDLLDGSVGDDVLDGDAGSDSVRFQTATGGVIVDLAAPGPQNTVGAGIDTLLGVENAFGTSNADTLLGNDGANELNAFAGTDNLVGRGGADTLLGGFQDDSIGARDGGPDLVDCGGGSDSVEADLVGTDSLIDCENATFGAPGPILAGGGSGDGPGEDSDPGPGGGPGPRTTPDAAAPLFTTRVRAVPSEFLVNRRGPAETLVRAGARRGTTFRYALSEAATVTFAMKRRLPGRLVGGKCRRPTTMNRSRRRCVRLVGVGAFRVAGVAGPNRKRFSGRIGKRTLRPGGYVARVSARDAAGNVSKPASAKFTVLRP